MKEQQVTILFEKLDAVNANLTTVITALEQFEKIIFLLQTIALSTSFCWGILLMQLIIHAKNQKNIL